MDDILLGPPSPTTYGLFSRFVDWIVPAMHHTVSALEQPLLRGLLAFQTGSLKFLAVGNLMHISRTSGHPKKPFSKSLKIWPPVYPVNDLKTIRCHIAMTIVHASLALGTLLCCSILFITNILMLRKKNKKKQNKNKKKQTNNMGTLWCLFVLFIENTMMSHCNTIENTVSY